MPETWNPTDDELRKLAGMDVPDHGGTVGKVRDLARLVLRERRDHHGTELDRDEWRRYARECKARAERAEMDARNYKRERDAAHREVADRTAERDQARATLAVLDRQRQSANADDLALLGSYQQARAALARVEAIHFVTASTAGPLATNCAGCSYDWPCPTVRALSEGPPLEDSPPAQRLTAALQTSVDQIPDDLLNDAGRELRMWKTRAEEAERVLTQVTETRDIIAMQRDQVLRGRETARGLQARIDYLAPSLAETRAAIARVEADRDQARDVLQRILTHTGTLLAPGLIADAYAAIAGGPQPDWTIADARRIIREFNDQLCGGTPRATEWIPCCDHCGCTDDRSGHDDTCRYGCNDTPQPTDAPTIPVAECSHPTANRRIIWQAMHTGDVTSIECLRCGLPWTEPYRA